MGKLLPTTNCTFRLAITYLSGLHNFDNFISIEPDIELALVKHFDFCSWLRYDISAMPCEAINA